MHVSVALVLNVHSVVRHIHIPGTLTPSPLPTPFLCGSIAQGKHLPTWPPLPPCQPLWSPRRLGFISPRLLNSVLSRSTRTTTSWGHLSVLRFFSLAAVFTTTDLAPFSKRFLHLASRILQFLPAVASSSHLHTSLLCDSHSRLRPHPILFSVCAAAPGISPSPWFSFSF